MRYEHSATHEQHKPSIDSSFARFQTAVTKRVFGVCSCALTMESTSSELRRLKKRAYMQERRRDQTSSLTPWCLQTALLIPLLLNYDFSAGAH